MPELIHVYDLREDRKHIAAVQKATLTTKEFGLVPEHGLFGSSEWWRAIGGGTIPTHLVEGVISRVFASGHHNYEEFEIENGGEKSCWGRQTSPTRDNDYKPDEKAALYRVGQPARLVYVVQKFKQPIAGLATSKCVLGIWIGA